jgi:ribosomal protein L37AE/L43A
MSSTPSDKAIQALARCPYCHSTNVTRGEKPTASSYWRCGACDQMWHPDRLQRNIDYRGGGRR